MGLDGGIVSWLPLWFASLTWLSTCLTNGYYGDTSSFFPSYSRNKRLFVAKGLDPVATLRCAQMETARK